MARPPATAADEAFLREVDEGLRRDQIAAAARRWGVIAIGGVVLALAALAGFLYWQHRTEQTRGVEGEQLQTALDDYGNGRTRQAGEALAPLESASSDGTRASAKLAQAELLLARNDMRGAIARFAAIADDASLGQPFRDYATLRRTAIEFDTLPPQQAVERLRPLAVAGNPWFGSAGELTAIAYLRQNRRDLAGRMFGQVAKADGVPATIRQRAVQMAGLLGVDAAPSRRSYPHPMTKFFRAPVMVAALIALAGCGIFKGGGKRTPTVGNRVPILVSENAIERDPSIADVQVLLPAAAANDSWTQPGGNAAKSMGQLALGATPARLWTAQIDGGSDRERLAAAPVIADGKLFIVDVEGQLHAFAADTGAPLWTAPVAKGRENRSSRFGGGASYDDGNVYATDGLGDVVAFKAADGTEIWRAKPGGPLRGSPTIANGIVYALSQDDQLFALDQDKGTVSWAAQGTAETQGVFGVAAPAAGQGSVVAGFSSGELNAYRYENGRQLWQDALSRTSISTSVSSIADIDAAPVIDNGRVYAVGKGGRMVALDLGSGRRLWEQNLAGIATPWLAGEWLFVVTDDSRLICLSGSSGKARWIAQLQRFRKEKGKKDALTWFGPVLAGGRLVLTNSLGQIVFANPNDGTVASTMRGSNQPFSLPPVVANSTLYTIDGRGRITAWR